ncbi:MAG: hypothetical protein RI928_1743 [Pseudomonadota bacterium]
MITSRFSQAVSLAIEAHDGDFRKCCFVGIFPGHETPAFQQKESYQ